MAQTQLELIISVIDQATAELRSISQNVEGVSQAAKSAERGGLAKFTQGLQDVRAGWEMAKEAGRAFIGVFQTTIDLARQAGAIERAERSFNALSGSTEDAAANLEAMDRAANGALSQIDAMAAGSKLMAMGLATDAGQLEETAEMAIRLGQAFGRDAKTSIEEFTLMLANQSSLRLDTFGISSGRVRERIEELMATMEGLTREEAFKMATFEEGRKSLEMLGPAVDDVATSVEQLEAAFADLKAKGLEKASPWLKNVTDAMLLMVTAADKIKEALKEQEANLADTSESYEDYFNGMMDALVAAKRMPQYIADNRKELIGLGENLDYVAEHYGFMTSAMYDAQTVTDGWMSGVEAANREVEDLAPNLDEATRRQIILNTAFGDGTMDAEELREAVEGVDTALDELDEESATRLAGAIGGARDAMQEFGAETLKVHQLDQMLQMLEGTWDEQEIAAARAGDALAQAFLDGEISADEFMAKMREVRDDGSAAMDVIIERVLAVDSELQAPILTLQEMKAAIDYINGSEMKPKFDFSALDDPYTKLMAMRAAIEAIGGAEIKWGGIQVPGDTSPSASDPALNAGTPYRPGASPSGGFQYDEP